MSRRLTAVDLFAGAGGATQGLRDAGFDVLDAVENDVSAVASYEANHGPKPSLGEDIRNVNADAIAKRDELSEGRLDVLNACPPCQGWSTLGTLGESDPRNELVGHLWRFVRALKPRAFVVENVPGIRSDVRMSRLVRQCRGAGYGVRKYLVDAISLGVPQRRRRLIVVGIDGRLSSTFPREIETLAPVKLRNMKPTVGEVIDRAGPLDQGVDTVHRARFSSKEVVRRLASVPTGGTRFDMPRELWLECHTRLGSKSATAAYGRMRPDSPAPTLTTRCTTPACGRFGHPTENRGISLREAALLQTFPLSYTFKGTYGEIESQVGNAMPPRMAEGVSIAVIALTSNE